MGTLCPFVPCVDEDKALSKDRILDGVVDQGAQPSFVLAWRGLDKPHAFAWPSSFVVPARGRRSDQRKFRLDDCATSVDEIVIREIGPRKVRIVRFQRSIYRLQIGGKFVGRKLNCATQTELSGIVVSESLGHENERILIVV